jgi:AraC family transcriptional regulator of arabinose operon
MRHKIFALDDSDAPNHAYIHLQGVDREQDLTLVQCGHQVTAPSYGYGPMIRDHYLLHLVRSGKGRLFIHNCVYTISKNSCFLIYPHQIAYYEADAEEPWNYYWIGICGYSVERIIDRIGFSYNRVILPLYIDQPLFHALEQMVASITDPEFDLLLNGLLRIVLHYLVRNHDQLNPDYLAATNTCIQTESVMCPQFATCQPNMDDEYVRIVTSIIQTSFMQNIRIEEIADKMRLNRSYLTSIFRKYTGKSIRSYLTDFRIEQACILLKDGRRSIASVASEVGFSDPLYFSRAFSSLKGYSPRKYRSLI